MALDDGDDGEFDVYNQGQSVSPPPALPIMPPPPPMSAMFDGKTGTFHPDFMFCGTCTDCQPLDSSKSELDVEEKLETYLDDASVTSEVVVLETKLMLRNPITNPSQGLVIQSLLQPLPGVTRVFVESGEPSSVTIGHDASTSTEGILSALESVGHFAFVQAPKVNPGGDLLWVRSQFYVKGICCASEVPAVKRIVKPMLGVSKLQINITTKMVHVQHDVSIVSAQQIADKLSREGFPTTIQKDGQGMAQAKKEALHIGRTTLHVQGVLTDGDVPKIQQQLNQTTGVTKIGVNVSEGVIYVDHDIYSVTSTLCVERLKPNFTCVVAIAGEKAAGDAAASALNQIGKSKYVESTLMIPDMQTPHLKILEKAISQNFIRAQVRAIYPNLVSKTIKVEHDPSMVPIRDIVATLSNYHLEVTVTVDGEDLNLYLPVQEDYPSNQVAYGEEPSLMQIHANVWLSGIFWVLSILSYRDGWYVCV